jgi:RHS repeat-associated protein
MIRIADPKPAPDQLAYTGRELDELHFYRRRHFDPTVGRWLDREPAGYADAALHRYAGNRPQ